MVGKTTHQENVYPDLRDVIIIGAGPCGLAVAARLREETPSAIFTDEEHQRYHWIKRHSGRMALVRAHNKKMNVKAEKWRGRNNGSSRDRRRGSSSSSSAASSSSSTSTLVLDSSGENWMQRWHHAFKTLEIEQLRSPMFFHVDPGDRDGMLAYAQETGREKDLWEISGCVGKEVSKHKKKKQRSKARTVGEVEIDERDRKDYYSPSTGLFADYCDSVISRYGLDMPGQVLKCEAEDIQYDIFPEVSTTEKVFAVTTTEGSRFYSRAVVLAIGAGKAKIYPWKLSNDEETAACHSMDIRSFPSPTVRAKIQRHQETNVVVVGGGLSSAQIVDMAIRKGVTKVWFLLRSELKVKHFDIGLTWMGKFKNFEKAAFWSADSDEERLEMIKVARNGGSITPRYHKILKQHATRKRVTIHPGTVICGKQYCPESRTWQLVTDPPIPDLPPIDYIYFATGVKSDVSEMPVLQRMLREYPIEIKQGLPCITDDLMWKSDVPLFVTGRLAALRLGPGAPNLEGARLGAERVAWGLQDALGLGDETDDADGTGLSRKCFCGLGNRYAGLGETSW